MKKITTGLAIIALALTLSTMALGQNGRSIPRRTSVQPRHVICADGDPIGHVRGHNRNSHSQATAPQAQGNQIVDNSVVSAGHRSFEGNPDRPLMEVRQGASRKEFDKSYFPPYSL